MNASSRSLKTICALQISVHRPTAYMTLYTGWASVVCGYPWISTENMWIWIWIWMNNFTSTASLVQRCLQRESAPTSMSAEYALRLRQKASCITCDTLLSAFLRVMSWSLCMLFHICQLCLYVPCVRFSIINIIK